MRVLILYQATSGGTNVLLQKAADWLKGAGHEVTDLPSVAPDARIDLVLLPTSELHQVDSLRRRALRFDRILVWAMGSRSFHGAFYDQMNRSHAFGVAMMPWRVLCACLMKALLAHRSAIFTDEVGMNSDVRCAPSPLAESDLIYPIGIRPPAAERPSFERAGGRRFTWIGRIDDDFKVLPLLRVVRDIAGHFSDGHNVDFLIIGSGNADELLRQEIVKHPHIRFTWLPRVANNELETILPRETEILFAMGTSALEGARVGVPTVLVQPFSRPEEEPLRPYRWIGTTVGHSLGEFPWAEYPPCQPKLSFGDLWDASLEERSRESHSFSGRFDMEKVFPRLFGRPHPEAMRAYLKALLWLHAMQHSAKRSIRYRLTRPRGGQA